MLEDNYSFRQNRTDLNKYTELVRELNQENQLLTGRQATVFTHTYGCQQNVSDGEKIDGLFVEMGYNFVSSPEDADVVLYNTCAIREGAEDRVFGNVGALKHAKLRNPDMLIGLCGCMPQQKHVAERISESFRFVDLVFGAGAMHQLPEMLYKKRTNGGRLFEISNPTIEIAENLPTRRQENGRAWLPIMSGCDNFCTYCVVPLVRGRERSREPENIYSEVKQLVKEGVKEITLLGQNVNSYGKGLAKEISFSYLLEQLCAIDGDFRLRFMTSHPKDCTRELIDVVSRESKLVKHFHLPIQSGSNRVLSAMNRGYTVEQYLSLVKYAREVAPNITFTSDIIVGFPSETYEEFSETVYLVKKIEFSALYTFIYSAREGTKAAAMPDIIPLTEKKKWFQELLDIQNNISKSKHEQMVGRDFTVLADSLSKHSVGNLSGRSESNVTVDFKAPIDLLGEFVKVRITSAKHWAVIGEIIS